MFPFGWLRVTIRIAAMLLWLAFCLIGHAIWQMLRR